jgi:hypothetical protein
MYCNLEHTIPHVYDEKGERLFPVALYKPNNILKRHIRMIIIIIIIMTTEVIRMSKVLRSTI